MRPRACPTIDEWCAFIFHCSSSSVWLICSSGGNSLTLLGMTKIIEKLFGCGKQGRSPWRVTMADHIDPATLFQDS